MEMIVLIKIILSVILLMNLVKCEPNELAESTGKEGGWLQSAQTMLAGPTGQMMVHVAKELINRSVGNSQILSLNLSNLIILIILKALIFTAGIIGAGHWSHYARSRSLNNSVINKGEPGLYVGFLAAQGTGDVSCLYKAACQAPATAYEYARAAKALLNGIEKFGGIKESKSRYNNLIHVLDRAAYDGYKGAPCDLLYHCNV